jgi:hypothetical protein
MQNKFLKKRLPDITAIIMITGAVFIFFNNLLTGEVIATNDITTNDLLFFSFPIRFLYAEALKAGEILQWTPYIFSGFPVFAEGQNGFLYPFNLITCYLLNPVQAMNWFLIFHAILAGTGVYFFIKKISGNGWLSIPVAVAYAICGSFTTGHTRHLNIYAVIALAPWLFLFAEYYIKKFRISYAMFFGSILGLMLLTNHPQYSFICGFITVLYIFLRFYFGEMKFREYYKKIILFFLIAIGISLLIGYAQVRDTIQLSSFSIRTQENLTEKFTGMGSLPWNGLLTFIYPYFMGNAGNFTFKSEEQYLFWEYFHYIGLIIFAFALIAIFKRIKTNQYVKIFTIIAVLSFLFALGENLKLYKVFSFIPLVSSFRFPARWLIGTELSFIFISIFGIKYVIEILTGVKSFVKQSAGKKAKPINKIITKKRDNVLSRINENKPYIIGISLSILVFFDIYTMTGRGVVTSNIDLYYPKDNQIINSLCGGEFRREFTMGNVELGMEVFNRSRGWEGDKTLYKVQSQILPPNTSSYYHINTVCGYTNLCPNYVYDVWGDANHPGIIRKIAQVKDKRTLQVMPQFVTLSRMWGVKDFLSYYNLSEPFVLKSDTMGVKHYQIDSVFPRAWVVKDILSTPADDRKSAEMLISDKFNPLEKAVVNGEPPVLPVNSENSKAEVLEVNNHSMKIRTFSPGLVVISDTWYPKWKAKINGQETSVYRVNNSMRGVVSPSADSEIELYYDNGNISFFLVLSLFTLIVVFAYGTFDYFKNKKLTSGI